MFKPAQSAPVDSASNPARLNFLQRLESLAIRPAARDYYPNAPREWSWQYVFSAAKLCAHPRTGEYARHHLHEASMQRQFKDAVRKADLSKPASCHSLCHSFATSLLQHGSDIRTVQHLMGHASVETTMIYLHLLERPGAGAPSPLDFA